MRDCLEHFNLKAQRDKMMKLQKEGGQEEEAPRERRPRAMTRSQIGSLFLRRDSGAGGRPGSFV